MKDPVIIERSELSNIVRRAVTQANRKLLKEIVNNKYDPWITQSQATRILGRRKLERGMKKGLIRFHKRNPETRQGRVMIRLEDVEKVKEDPTI